MNAGSCHMGLFQQVEITTSPILAIANIQSGSRHNSVLVPRHTKGLNDEAGDVVLYKNRIRSKLCLAVILQFYGYYNNAASLLRGLCRATHDLAQNDSSTLKQFCSLYSGERLEFDLAVERNTALILQKNKVAQSATGEDYNLLPKIRQERFQHRYFKQLVLKNWRAKNDLKLYLEPIILKNMGYETLVFQFDFSGLSADSKASSEDQKQENEGIDYSQRGYSDALLKYITKMHEAKRQQGSNIEVDLVNILEKVKKIHFDYSSDDDFQTKMKILNLVVKNERKLRNLEAIEFDYVRTSEEMQELCSINRQLIDLKFPCLVGLRVMSTIIKTETLDAVLRKAHKISKFFITIDDSDNFRRDWMTLNNCIYRFHSLDCLGIQLEVEAIKMDLKIFALANREEEKPAPLRRIEIMCNRNSLFELKNFHIFNETLKELSISYFEIDLFNEYIEDQEALMDETQLLLGRCHQEGEMDLQVPILPVLTNQLIVLEIHKGHPLKREIFAKSLALSESIKELKVSFDWQVGPRSALERILTKNQTIRKLHLLIEGYDNNLCFLDYFRANRWISELHLDVVFHDLNCIKNKDGYEAPIYEETGLLIPSPCRVRNLVLYHGVKYEKARNDFLAAFPPLLIEQMPCLTDLTILSFLDDENYSRQLIRAIPQVERLKFRFMNDEPLVSFFLESLKESEFELNLKRLEIYGGRSFKYGFDQSQLCFILSRSKSCPHLRELELANLDIYDFERFLARLLQSNYSRPLSQRITHLGFINVNISLELENTTVFLKAKLPTMLWKHGRGLKSFSLTRKNQIQYRSEQSREMFKSIGNQLVGDKSNDLIQVLI